MGILFPPDEFQKLKDLLTLYRCALLDMQTRLDILLEDYKNLQSYNPIEHVKNRLKSPESIADKLHRLNFELTASSARENLTDIAGLRCICLYAKDIPFIVNALKRQPDLTVLKEKDYVTNPKPSGYRSYHIIFKIPVHLAEVTEYVPVEVQVRTQAMDFWASLEHTARYKYKDQIPQHLAHALIECADQIAELDKRMYNIQDLVEIAYDDSE